YPYTGESGYECMPTVLSDARGPFGRNVPLAAAIRRALRDAGHATPVVTSGSITTFEQARGSWNGGRRTAWRPRGSTVRLASDGKRRLLPPSWTPPSADWRHRARRLLVGSACALRIVSDQWRDCSVTLFVEGRVSMALDRSAHHVHRLSRDR